MALGTVAIALNDNASAYAQNLIDTMVLNKLSTASGIERSAWNEQALQNFFDTFGFGVGNGSVRASSFPIGVLASLGERDHEACRRTRLQDGRRLPVDVEVVWGVTGVGHDEHDRSVPGGLCREHERELPRLYADRRRRLRLCVPRRGQWGEGEGGDRRS